MPKDTNKEKVTILENGDYCYCCCHKFPSEHEYDGAVHTCPNQFCNHCSPKEEKKNMYAMLGKCPLHQCKNCGEVLPKQEKKCWDCEETFKTEEELIEHMKKPVNTEDNKEWEERFDERFPGRDKTSFFRKSTVKFFIASVVDEEREKTKRAFFQYLFENNIEEDLKGRFADTQYEMIWKKIISYLSTKE